MKRNRGVASALATLMLAAGISSSVAQQTDALDAEAQDILGQTSVEALESELARQLEHDPNNPLARRIVSRIVELTKLSTVPPTAATTLATAAPGTQSFAAWSGPY